MLFPVVLSKETTMIFPLVLHLLFIRKVRSGKIIIIESNVQLFI